jgi:hypothetical protein
MLGDGKVVLLKAGPVDVATAPIADVAIQFDAHCRNASPTKLRIGSIHEIRNRHCGFSWNVQVFFMLARKKLHERIAFALARSRGAVLNGPRPSGKITLGKDFLRANSPNYFDLENPLQANRPVEPMQTLSGLTG